MKNENNKSLWQPELMTQAVIGSFIKLNPIGLLRNPVMLIVEIGSFITTLITFQNVFIGRPYLFDLQISIYLWFTVIFANFAEALAEGKGKAQAQALKRSRDETSANKVLLDGSLETVSALSLLKEDIIVVNPNEIVACDGEIIEGVALIDESAITGESAPVVRESGGDKSAVTGGTKVLSGTIKIIITAKPGETFIDQMIKMVESAKRQKTPNEKALEILLIGLTILFIVVITTTKAYAGYMGVSISIPILISLLVCLMPTTIGGLLPAIGISGMERLLSHNTIALSGKAVEAAGDVNFVLLDKTGTITLGNRAATDFIPVNGVKKR